MTVEKLYFAGGILTFYGLLGIAQEKITKADYGDDKFIYQAELVFTMVLSNLVFAAWSGSKRDQNDKTPKLIYILCAICYVTAMLSSNYALKHVSYPTQVLGKSCKPVAVMLMCLLLRQKSYNFSKYFCVFLIVAGVMMFLYNPKKSTGSGELGTGELWILASLAMDGCVASCQEFMKKNYQSPKSNMMLNLNLVALIVLVGQSLASGTFFGFFGFVQRNPDCMKWLAALGICSALGQHFIFSIVTGYGPLLCSIVTTTRKFFTILLSVVLFGNSLTTQQWSGSVLVFIGLALDGFLESRAKSGAAAQKKKSK
ncbi:unnamed protein product [Oikopleura dioica]|uniref:Solute carrier family 35 member B1 n=1 Tax=Oikopleura dioica TaxID=34765 RepID=E4Y1C0_OIKDI|nr:unnamed protein product [Oikopleura dioica]CBY35246.1 unnamed protein product [Oikopleura dioica]